MAVAFAHVGDAIAARAGVPGAISGGWFRLPDGCGSALFWVEMDRPVMDSVCLWRSRQAAALGEFENARVVSVSTFARMIAPTSQPSPTDRAIAETVAKMGSLVDRVCTRVDKLEAGVPSSADVRLLAMISTHMPPDTEFTVVDLIAHGVRAEPALLLAIKGACKKGVNGRSLGKKLVKLSKNPPPGFELEWLCRHRDGETWKLHRVSV
jgi:hypothetical protein